MENKDVNYEKICNLFRKVITSLVCIEYNSGDDEEKRDVRKFLDDIVEQYSIYVLKLNSNLIGFKYSEKEVIEFASSFYDDVDIFNFAEDLEFGFSELVENILSERRNKDGR